MSKLLKNTAYYGIVPAVPKVVSILLLPLLTMHLTSVDYGIAGTIVAYTTAIAAFSTLGCTAFITSSFYHYGSHYKIIWRQVYGFLQYWMVLFAILQSVLLYFIIPEEAIENRWLIIILANFNNVFFGPSAILGAMYYRLNQEPKPVVFRSLACGLITVFSNLIFIVYLESGYMGWYISSFLGTFCINASYWYVLNHRLGLKPSYILNLKAIKHVLKVSLPTIPHAYSTYLINGSNKFVMDRANTPLSAIGQFNFASEFMSYFELFASAVNSAISPMFMEELKRGNILASHRIFKQSLVFFSIAVCGFIIWSREIFLVMVRNEDLSSTYWIASILVAGFIHRPLYLAVTSAMFYYEKTASLMKISLTGGLIAFLGYCMCIPLWGITSAAIITYLSFLAIGYFGYVLPSTRKLYILPYKVWNIFIALHALLVVAFFIMQTPLYIKVIFSISILILLNKIRNNL